MRRWTPLLLLALLLAACGQATPQVSQTAPRPSPTIAPFFSGGQRPQPTIEIPTAQPRPTAVAGDDSVSILEATASAARTNSRYEEILVFDERLSQGWSLDSSWGMRINRESRSFAEQGRTALEALPTTAFGGVRFALTGDSRSIYPRSEVVGFRFVVSGGDSFLEPHNLIVKVSASNRYPYYVESDSSVAWPAGYQSNRPVMDEVTLDSLGMRRDLEPGQWAQIDVVLDAYDQVPYEYVTGLVLMNAPTQTERFFVDRVSLLLREP